ncbi:hypothetical protein F5Y14DRAFT_445866 [Nemania sp. NC0429]|nr:hypothetical protein F5Y14DRAFT_445866 [Nemania sp. NC0429]
MSATVIYGDNQGAIAMAKNPQFHSKMKHVLIQQAFCREAAQRGDVDFQDKFIVFRDALGLRD